MKLAILIPTIHEREGLRHRLIRELEVQIGQNIRAIDYHKEIDIIINVDGREKLIGQKRNELIQRAVEKKAEYIAFFDDDDLPGPTYIKRGLEVAESGMDCGELWGQIYWDGKPGNPFHHFINCVNPANGKIEWWQDDKFYYRMINHLNFQKLSLVKDIPFPEKNFGEDGVQSELMRDAGVFKTMYPIPEVIYHYFNGTPKHAL
jgi:hypothetical protein